MNSTTTLNDKNENKPSLLECCNSIKYLGCIGSNTTRSSDSGGVISPKEKDQLITSCVGLLTYIQLDRITIEKHGENTFPTADDLPAISKLLNDRKLFHTFLAMLRSKGRFQSGATTSSAHPVHRHNSIGFKTNYQSCTTSSGSSMKSIQPQKHAQQPNHDGRKRSLSGSGTTDFDIIPNNKRPKLTISPHPDRSSITNIPLTPINSSSKDNLAVLAANVFYSAFQYLDQWPPVFVEAFAEDSFGSRVWVDNERTKVFVDNLMAVIQNVSSESDNTQVTLDEGDTYLEHFNTILGGTNESCTQEKTDHHVTKHKIRTMSIDATKLVNAEMKQEYDSDSVQEGAIVDAIPRFDVDRQIEIDKTDDSSSSGEEAGEEVMISNLSFPSFYKQHDSEQNHSNSVRSISPIPSLSNRTISMQTKNWWCSKKVVRSKIYNRFLGSNRIVAKQMIGEALARRLDLKVKQNSSLLTSLLDFVSDPTVRESASSHLEKWLQSPALSTLARSLFSSIVRELKNTEPPLPEDVKCIQNLLKMNLKTNQFDIHSEKIIEMVQNVPNVPVCRQVIYFLLSKQVDLTLDMEVLVTAEISGELDMLKSLLIKISPSLAYKSLALALLSILNENAMSDRSGGNTIDGICKVLRSLVLLLGEHYDGCLLVDSILHSESSYTKKIDFIVFSRLILETILLIVPESEIEAAIFSQSKQFNATGLDTKRSQEVVENLYLKMLSVKKLLLTWYLNSQSLWPTTKQNIDLECIDLENNITLPSPNFTRIFEDRTKTSDQHGQGDLFLDTLRCLLFLCGPESSQMRRLLQAGSILTDQILSQEKKSRILCCMKYGCYVDNEIFHIIINNSGLSGNGSFDPINAICIIEEILIQCKGCEKTKLLVDDCNLIWNLYNLTRYSPRILSPSIPEVAFSELWWRVTMISLVFCGISPKRIGAELFSCSPTIQSLIKMIVSGKFTFPTVDCDETQSKSVQIDERLLEEKELEIVETLFLPPRQNVALNQTAAPTCGLQKGSRSSARQREKQERELMIRREKEKALAIEEAKLRKQRLQKFQNAIMLLDPRCPARKPRKELMSILFSIDSLFQLSKSFKDCTTPDYLLASIGSTSRDSIERAYYWLIPTISSSPDIINRLPPSASCFLLQRAYGSEGSENDQLLDLSSPLLNHVNESIDGAFGLEGAQRAADILFFDLASKDPDRRRCARRVLQETVGKMNIANEYPTFASGDFSWLISLTKGKYAASLVQIVTPQLMHALSFERGQVLRAYIMALDYYIRSNVISGLLSKMDLSSCLCDLLSSRPNICISAVKCYQDLRNFMVHTCQVLIENKHLKTNEIGISLSVPSRDENIHISLSVVRASLALIASWNETNIPPGSELMKIVEFLLPHQVENEKKTSIGAASATFLNTKKPAITIDDWIPLVKSDCVLIARRSVFSAPDSFLTRLLLCCGLPQSSFTTILDRLHDLGSSAPDADLYFKGLISCTRKGQRRSDLIRTLLGKITAYMDRNTLAQRGVKSNRNDTSISTSCFITWLEGESFALKSKSPAEKSSNGSEVKAVPSTIIKLLNVRTASNSSEPLVMDPQAVWQLPKLHGFNRTVNSNATHKIGEFYLENVKHCVLNQDYNGLNEILKEAYSNYHSQSHQTESDLSIRSFENIAVYLLTKLRILDKDNEGELPRLILQWIPKMTSEKSNEIFLRVFLHYDPHTQDHVSYHHEFDFENLLLTRCLALWPFSQINACQWWILQQMKQKRFSGLNLNLCMRILVYFMKKIKSGQCQWKRNNDKIDVLESEDQSRFAIELALLGAKEWFHKSDSLHEILNDPIWLELLILIGGIDQKNLNLTSETILSKLPSNDTWENKLLPIALLKLYSNYPKSMDLSVQNLRNTLVEASSLSSHVWFQWETPLDSSLISAVTFLSNPFYRQQQQLICELSKKHPLITIKRLMQIASVLENDAESGVHHFETRSRQCKESLVANLEDKEINVYALHWGMRYTEQLWLSVLDILASFPDTVIYSKIGFEMGLDKVLTLYLKLLYVQYDQSSSNNSDRLRDKFVTTLQTCFSLNEADSIVWLKAKQTGFSVHTMEDIMTLVGISHVLYTSKDAIDNNTKKIN